MTIERIRRLQASFDKRHGWSADRDDPNDVLYYLGRDLVGLFGEVGEFANIVKKLELHRATPRRLESELALAAPDLAEELTDIFIYLLRFAETLDVDLQEQYAKKARVNEEKYKEHLV